VIERRTRPGLLRARGFSRGYTLVEMLVASFVFVLLGMLLVQTVKAAVDTWRMAEARRDVYERAQQVMDRITIDLTSTFADNRLGRDGSVRFLLARDTGGDSDLRFVARIGGELRRPLTREAGEASNPAAHRTLGLADRRPLLAGEGLEEIIYSMRGSGESRTMWRGVRSPIGGAGSLFALDPRTEKQGALKDQLASVAMPLAEGVLHFGFEAWDPASTLAWDLPPGSAGAPVLVWDSARRAGVFPELLRLTLVLAADPLLGRSTRLAEDISGGANRLAVENVRLLPDPTAANPYILIDDEWIRYGRRNLESGHLEDLTRGRRGTMPKSHKSGSRIEQGYSFTSVLSVRASR